MPDAPKTDKEMVATAVRITLQVVAAILVSALVEVILVTGFLMAQVSLGGKYGPIQSILPFVSALAGVPVLTIIKGKPLFVTAVFYAFVMFAAMWYFQFALLNLWGYLSATGTG